VLTSIPTTIPAEIRDFPEWHHGRETYAVWVLTLEDDAIYEKFKSARRHLDSYLLEPYRRQPHITLFVCGFLVETPHYNDDFNQSQLLTQLNTLGEANVPSFEIKIGGLNSFASAPFLEVYDPEGGIPILREALSRGAREFRTAPYTPHLTVGLYAGAFPSGEVLNRLAGFSSEPIQWKVTQITLATYRANEFTGILSYKHQISLKSDSGHV